LADMRPLATDDEFCEFTGISKPQSAQLRYLGTGPRFIRVTGKQIRYAWSEIEAWCESRTVSRSDQRNGDPPRAQRLSAMNHSTASLSSGVMDRENEQAVLQDQPALGTGCAKGVGKMESPGGAP
jgi:predicted DNA-binding transcriptional regulator AlpA